MTKSGTVTFLNPKSKTRGPARYTMQNLAIKKINAVKSNIGNLCNICLYIRLTKAFDRYAF